MGVMQATPPLEPGLTLVEQPDRGAIQRLVLESDVDGETLWIDAGATASTYDLTAMAPNQRAFRGIQIARAFSIRKQSPDPLTPVDLVEQGLYRVVGSSPEIPLLVSRWFKI